MYIEELVPVHVFVHGFLKEGHFKEILNRTELIITANATSAAPPPRLQQSGDAVVSEKPSKVSLDSITLDGDHATLVVSGSDDSPKCYAVFKAHLFLRYPSTKFHKPLIHFTASALLSATAKSITPPNLDSEYLPSGVPEAENLLGNLIQNTKTAQHTELSLPASRLIKVAPRASSTNGDIRPLRTSSKLIPILPILIVRVGSTAATRMSEPVASLDLELTRYVSCSVELRGVTLKASRLRAECLTESLQSSLVLYPGDRSSLMYKLLENGEHGTSAQSDQALEVDITAIVQLTDSCKPRLRSQWRGSVDPFFNHGSKNLRRPISTTFLPSRESIDSRPMSKHLSMTGRPLSMFGHDLGVTFSFTGPQNVKNGETFYLDIFVVNRSMRRKRLAIVAIPHSSKSTPASRYGPRPFSSSTDVPTWHRSGTAEAVADSKSLFNLQTNRQHHVAEVVSLNADVRIGYVEPSNISCTLSDSVTVPYHLAPVTMFSSNFSLSRKGLLVSRRYISLTLRRKRRPRSRISQT